MKDSCDICNEYSNCIEIKGKLVCQACKLTHLKSLSEGLDESKSLKQNKKLKWAFIASFFFPSIALLTQDSINGLIIAPFLFIFTLIAGGIVYLLLSIFKLPKVTKTLFILISSTLFSAWIFWTTFYYKTPHGTFKSNISSCVPSDIEFIERKGYIPLGGGSISLVFKISPESFEKMISEAKEFKACNSLGVISSSQYLRMELERYNLGPSYLLYHNSECDEIMSGAVLIVNAEKTLVYLYRWKT